ncbi:iron complex transport system permease protein [Priestia megaterium]|jgi:iron complex transport system permease protein|uniref:FecCD family ABC transporter permease n=1 Tax=Priestia megaterium TaxID=1404 RepID=UPI00119DF331|nr:iron chelate uptake ABC transporter family permease subunit [Priestia megaterium]MCM3019058.1 iron ABC transporter permease [Priestia megaterium]MCM3181570.1 iron ABC transporter permease [Priestia megaterium]MCM3194510.1 iron ABC transporter permease [Priestia megaterium]
MKRKHPYQILSILLLCLIITVVISLGVGAVYISPAAIFQQITGSSQESSFILTNYRIPRTLIAIVVGAALAIAGAILQGILKNPLASPDVIGVTKGAGLFAVFILIVFPAASMLLLPLSAFLGAAVIAVILMVFSYSQGAKPHTLALVGVALGAICQAGIQYFMIKFPDDVNTTLLWLTGSLWGRGWSELWMLIPCVVLVPFIIIFSSKLDILNLGDEIAVGLGERTKYVRYTLLSMAVILTGLSVAVVGSIGFIGLIAPHIGRRLVGSRSKFLLPVSAAAGALFLLIADSLGRGVMPPVEIPAGIVTAVIGAPYFLYLLRREQKK